MKLNENGFNLWGKITPCPCFNQSDFLVYRSVTATAPTCSATADC